MSDINYRNVGREIPEKYKYKFKYNPAIWGFKRPESFDIDFMKNPFNDMLDELHKSILSQISPYSKYNIEIVKDTGFVTIKWEE